MRCGGWRTWRWPSPELTHSAAGVASFDRDLNTNALKRLDADVFDGLEKLSFLYVTRGALLPA